MFNKIIAFINEKYTKIDETSKDFIYTLRKRCALRIETEEKVELKYLTENDALYTERSDSQTSDNISEIIQKNEVVAITGDAGMGKSSLLLKMHSQYYKKNIPVLAFEENTIFQDDKNNIYSNLLETIRKRKDKQIILIDTFDNTISTHPDFDPVRIKINALQRAGAKIVFFSRPEDIHKLISNVPEAKEIKLEKFSEETIKRNLYKYIKAAYKGISSKETTELMEYIYNNQSLRDLIKIPLHMRMLFEIYAPKEIPDLHRITAHELFQIYYVFKAKTNDRL
ncbi:MAG: hypothetical protein KKA19_02335 [Candidatus Margulisbacteria bacterium]|nr:hypothetical protein [Candidatus Margulisiibacteriota bacterium]